MKRFYPVLAFHWVALLAIPLIGHCQNPVTNQQIILGETTRLLTESSLVQGVEGAFLLDTNIPQNLRRQLVDPLLHMDKHVLMTSVAGGQKVSLEIHANNRFTRLNKRLGQRRIEGELIVYLSNGENVIRQTESLTFSHVDTVAVKGMEELSPQNWRAAQFHEEKDGRRRSFINRVAEPVVIVGASAVTIFLLYNVRR